MKLGISCGTLVQHYGYEKALELCKETGFDAVDFDLTLPMITQLYDSSEQASEDYFHQVRLKAEALGLTISQTHGRCITYTPDEEWCAKIRRLCEKDFYATKLLGAPACVVHPILSKPWVEHHQDEAFMHRKNKEFYDDITPFAEKNRIKFALETFGGNRINGEFKSEFFGDAKQLKKQFDLLDTPYKTLCVDTGHTNNTIKYGKLGPADAIRLFGKDVTLLHLHDNTGNNDTHLPPLTDAGEAGVCWPDVFDALEEIGYQGVYNFELNLNRYLPCLPEAMQFLGKWLRIFLENKGRM